MKFRPVKRYAGKDAASLLDWITNELNAVLRELYIGIGALTFGDNFLGYEWEGSIVAGAEQQIPHTLKTTPTRFLVLSPGSTPAIIKGDTAATAEVFYVKNMATTSTFEGKILVLP